MWPYAGNDPDVTAEEHLAFEDHLHCCSECAKEYEESKRLFGLLKRYCSEKRENQVLSKDINRSYKYPMTVEEGWQDLCRRCPDLARNPKRQKYIRLFYKIGAGAACIAIGIFTWTTFSIYLKPQVAPKPTPQQIAFAPKPSVKIELASETGNIIIPANQQITSGDGLKTLIINDKHQMVMNVDTTLAVKPLVEDSQIGCLVTLNSGRIYTHVEHDGNPFVVDTLNSKAIITGTTFDVEVTDIFTTLVVTEGSVQFKSEKGTVKVGAGQRSQIIGRSIPSKPVSCNTTELTKWATGYKNKTALTKINSSTDSHLFDDLEITVTTGPINLEDIDYDSWVKENRDWFRKEFPEIFQLKEALTKEGIGVDYPELLTRSGDIWQFVFPESTKQRIPVLSQKSLMRICSHHGYDDKWLLKSVPAVKYLSADNAATKNKFFGLEAFEQWYKRFEKAKQVSAELDSDILRYSFHAGFYIIKTRSLAWLCIQKDMFECQVQDEDKLLSLLQDEVKAVDDLVQITRKAMASSKNPCTGEIPHLNEQIECLERIGDIERQLTKYKDEIIGFEPFKI